MSKTVVEIKKKTVNTKEVKVELGSVELAEGKAFGQYAHEEHDRVHKEYKMIGWIHHITDHKFVAEYVEKDTGDTVVYSARQV